MTGNNHLTNSMWALGESPKGIYLKFLLTSIDYVSCRIEYKWGKRLFSAYLEPSRPELK